MTRPDVRPGRGAPENRTPDRFNLPQRVADGDWLDAREEVDGNLPPLRTTVTVEHPGTKEWIAAVGMDRFPSRDKGSYLDWRPGTVDLRWDRVVTKVDGNTITLDRRPRKLENSI